MRTCQPSHLSGTNGSKTDLIKRRKEEFELERGCKNCKFLYTDIEAEDDLIIVECERYDEAPRFPEGVTPCCKHFVQRDLTLEEKVDDLRDEVKELKKELRERKRRDCKPTVTITYPSCCHDCCTCKCRCNHYWYQPYQTYPTNPWWTGGYTIICDTPANTNQTNVYTTSGSSQSGYGGSFGTSNSSSTGSALRSSYRSWSMK